MMQRFFYIGGAFIGGALGHSAGQELGTAGLALALALVGTVAGIVIGWYAHRRWCT